MSFTKGQTIRENSSSISDRVKVHSVNRAGCLKTLTHVCIITWANPKSIESRSHSWFELLYHIQVQHILIYSHVSLKDSCLGKCKGLINPNLSLYKANSWSFLGTLLSILNTLRIRSILSHSHLHHIPNISSPCGSIDDSIGKRAYKISL